MTREPGRFFAENCAALGARDPGLTALLLETLPDPTIKAVSARSGALVPAVGGPDGTVLLHSRYDPAQEAERLAPEWEGAGCVVSLGLGGGFHVASMLRRGRIGAVLIVEEDAAVLRALFDVVPLGDIISDPRAWLLVGTRELARRLSELWQPALMGGLRTFALRAWCARHRDFWDGAAREVASAVEAVRADYSVQAHFGKRWFSNMLQNMPAAEASPSPLHLEAARVAAAGPSLERQLPRLAAARAEGPLLAVDTSLPALMRVGVQPDAVVSIDCQVHGYHHFLQGMPENAALYLDLASPPLLARGRRNARFVAGNHPFAAYLCSRWRGFPRVDTSGGNVTHVAVSLALAMGARDVTLYGADFSYPAGKPYARGTYMYDVFAAAAGRLQPMDGRFYSFLFRADDTWGERAGDHLRYRTALLDSYRERLLALVSASDARIVAVPGDGLPLAAQPLPAAAGAPRSSVPARTEPSCGWRELLDQYALTLTRLPGLHDPPWAALHSLGGPQREAWATLLPIAACVAREFRAPMSEAAALEAARGWALARVRRHVESGTAPDQE